MEKSFDRLKAEADNYILPEECEENDRAVHFLALELGVGHYDNLNLLLMAALMIFISVTFLAVNGGDIDDNRIVSLSSETFLSGEYTKAMEENYNRQLPVPDLLKSVHEHIALIYGVGNTLSDPVQTVREQEEVTVNPFEPESDNGETRGENAITTKAVQTDEFGNVTTAANEVTAPGGGTTAVERPTTTSSWLTFTTTTEPPETTTTNNDIPSVTYTTTIPAQTSPTLSQTSKTDETSQTEPTETTPDITETTPDITEPTETTPDITEPPATSEPADTDELPAEPPVQPNEPELYE